MTGKVVFAVSEAVEWMTAWLFKAKRLHRADAHGVKSRVKSSGRTGTTGEQDHSDDHNRLDLGIDVAMQGRNQLESYDRAGSDDESQRGSGERNGARLAEDESGNLGV